MRIDQACLFNEFPLWDLIAKLAFSSRCQTCLCKNGIGDLMHNCCLHTLGKHWNLSSNLTLTQKIHNLCIFR